jgi:predicted nucleic acid-binding protein
VIILDTDALSHLRKRNSVGIQIAAWLDASPDRETRITALTAYEVMRGAVGLVSLRMKQRVDLIPAFFLLEESVKYLATWKEQILSYDENAEQIYRGFPPRLRQELKDDARIAAVALVHNAAVWTCNIVDYARVPGLILVDARTGSAI